MKPTSTSSTGVTSKSKTKSTIPRPATSIPSPRDARRLSGSVISKLIEKKFGDRDADSDCITVRRDLGKVNTAPKIWRRGDVVLIPHIVPDLGDVDKVDIIRSKRIGDICVRLRHAIVVAVLQSNLIVFPILTSNGSGLSIKFSAYKLTVMKIMPPADDRAHVKASDNRLYIADNRCLPSPNSYINLSEPLVVQYAWPLNKYAQLEDRSTAILIQRYHIAHNMASVPLDLQESYFRAMVTREPILGPIPGDRAAEEFYITLQFVPSCGRTSLASDNEDLLVDDLGYGIVRGQHDNQAAIKLIQWEPSLKSILEDNERVKNSSGSSSSRSSTLSWSYSPIESPGFSSNTFISRNDREGSVPPQENLGRGQRMKKESLRAIEAAKGTEYNTLPSQ